MYLLFQYYAAATAILPTIVQPHQKELQMQITKEITIITIIPIANAPPVAPHIMMDIARNADIPTSIRAGWEKNIN